MSDAAEGAEGAGEQAMRCSDEERDATPPRDGAGDDDLSATLRDVHFVSIVRGYDELHARAHPRHADRAHRRRVWRDIGLITNRTPEDCRKRWKSIRQNYYRSLKRAKTHADKAHYLSTRPAHERLMSFLDTTSLATMDALDSENDHSNDSDNILAEEQQSFDVSDSSCSDDDQSPSVQAGDAPPAPAPHELPPEDDYSVQFFSELGESIKDLPEGVKIKVKREVFKIVVDAEEKLYHKKLKDELEAQINTSEEHK